jgi:putative transcriptional regulator
MTKNAFSKIMAGLQDTLEYVEGERAGFVTHIPEEVDLKGIRKGLGLSQVKFAEAFGFSPGRVRDWEQARFAIDAASRVLLTVIAKEPAAVLRALGQQDEYVVTVHAKRASGSATSVAPKVSKRSKPENMTIRSAG